MDRDKYDKEIQYCVAEIQIGPGKNPGDVTLRQHARREAGSWPIFFLNFVYTIESFYCPGQIIHASTECLQLRWPLCVCGRGCTFFLQLLTGLEDRHCTCFMFFFILDITTNLERSNYTYILFKQYIIDCIRRCLHDHQNQCDIVYKTL